jgi:hypothetical protein
LKKERRGTEKEGSILNKKEERSMENKRKGTKKERNIKKNRKGWERKNRKGRK